MAIPMRMSSAMPSPIPCSARLVNPISVTTSPRVIPTIKGISSLKILEHVAGLIAARNATIGNVDATLVAEAPKILPHTDAMKTNIATALGIDKSQVGIKATTNETLGFPGREEGMCALASACIQLPK